MTDLSVMTDLSNDYPEKKSILSAKPAELVFRNDKFLFKPITEDDLELLLGWRRDEVISRYLSGTAPQSMEDQYRWYRKYLEDELSITFMVYSSRDPERRYGYCQLFKLDLENQSTEIGTVLTDRNLLGSGVGYTITTTLLQIAFKFLGINVIYGNNQPENAGSNKLHEHFFQSTRIDTPHPYSKEGHLLYELTKPAFKAFEERICSRRGRWDVYFDTVKVSDS